MIFIINHSILIFFFFTQVVDKKTKENSLNNQLHMTTEASDRQRNDDKVKCSSAGLSLRTRTLSSTTVPLPPLHQSTISVQPKFSSVVRLPRPRGRPPKNRNNLDDIKTLQPSFNKQSEEKKDCNLTLKITRKESAASSLERLQQQQKLLNLYNGVVYNYDDEQDNGNTNTTSTGVNINSTLPKNDKNQTCTNIDHVCKKKSYSRKRKQSNIEELVVKKRILISNHSKDTLALEKYVFEKSSLPRTSKVTDVNIVNYGFLAGYDIVEPYRQRTDIRLLSTCPLICFGSTYWPTSWEYSAATLTGHVQKKASKDMLRKIRLFCDMGITNKTVSLVSPLKTNLTLKKYKTSFLQRRGSANKLTASASFDIPSGSRQPSTSSTLVKRPPGRPPGKKNKLLQAVIKGNSPRKSPRQHASTLAAIMSNKATGNDKSVIEQHNKLLEADLEFNKISLDMDGPCVLTMAVPKYEHHSGVRHRRHYKQLNHQHNIIKRRCQRRSITPPPPKLCAQQLPPQRTHTNTTVVDQEVVKLRTKHVDVVRRRARDERLRAAFVCQQLYKVQEVAEQNRRDLVQEVDDEDELDYKLLSNAIVLSSVCNQEQTCPFQTIENYKEPDNMCLQIMYEQTTDKRFLCANLTDETLQIYYKQRDIALAERQANSNYGDTLSYDLGSDIVSAASKRKKKRPNMTGWPKEKRRKVISATSSMITSEEILNGDSDVEKNKAIKQRRALAAEKQKLRRRRLKLQQQLSKEKSKVKVATAAIRRRPGRPCGSSNKNKIVKYRTISMGSNSKDITANNQYSSNTTPVQTNKFKVKKQQQKCLPVHKKATAISIGNTTSDAPNRIVKRSCGRPKGSIGPKKRLKLQLLEQLCQNQTSLPEQQKENVAQQQTSSGKLKCVISTRKKRMTLLSTSSSPSSTLSQKKLMTGNKTKKKTTNVQNNLSSTCLASLSLPVSAGKLTRTTKRRRLQQQQQQMSTTSVTWDVGRPKRYHSANHGKNANNVDEDYCFVGSQPFEQHCPGVGGGLSQNTMLENQQYNQKENSLNPNL